MSLKSLKIIISILLCLLPGRVFSDTPGTEKEPIKIGAVLHLSGDFAMEGRGFQQGIAVGVDAVNESGGINGRKLEVIYEDSALQPRLAHTAVRKLLSVDNITALLIATYTELMSVASELEREGIPSITLWDSSKEIEDIGEYAFGIGTWLPSSGESIADFFITKLAKKKAAVLYQNNTWSAGCADFFSKRFEKLGGKVTYSIAQNPDDTDFRTILTKAKASGADAVYAPMGYHPIAFFKQVHELNMKLPVATSDIITETVIDEGGEVLEGLYQTMTGDPDHPEALELAKRYKRKYGKPAKKLRFNSWGYDAVQVLAIALRKAGTEGSKIKNELYKIKNHAGASGVITFNKKGSSPRLVNVFQVKSGKLKRVE